MSKATLVRVISEIEGVGGNRATMLWIVVTADPVAAVKAVKERVSAGCVVEPTDFEVLPETIQRLGLAPGQAHVL